ncbi:hypothetical protein SKAU_G00090650 [Synaphobranchus kaupii]|uniref:Ig-like domain-containing protein n=1 Tax=Synaphobranchus kaupii TaxID=118154 RepID=A0A9Q1FX34_SYNKA|nr:hypothetical protein SKAU_G00090650 [Synaphobranchus kaupii]
MEGKRIAHLVCLMVMLPSAGSADAGKLDIKTEAVGDQGVKITCANAVQVVWKKDDKLFHTNATSIELEYNDDSTGEYKCIAGEETLSIYVKFRTCDNCVDLDVGTVVGIVVGECVATALIGVAVYLLASQSQGKVYHPQNKASDRQNLLQNQQNDSTYQPLSHSGGGEYSQLEPRRGRKR